MSSTVDHAGGLIASQAKPLSAKNRTNSPESGPSSKVLASGFVIVLFAVFAALLIEANSDGHSQESNVLDGHGKWGGYLSAPANH